MRGLILTAALVALAGCEPTTVEPISSTDTAITYKVGLHAALQELDDKADAYCASKGLAARPSWSRPYRFDYTLQRYECVSRPK